MYEKKERKKKMKERAPPSFAGKSIWATYHSWHLYSSDPKIGGGSPRNGMGDKNDRVYQE